MVRRGVLDIRKGDGGHIPCGMHHPGLWDEGYTNWCCHGWVGKRAGAKLGPKWGQTGVELVLSRAQFPWQYDGSEMVGTQNPGWGGCQQFLRQAQCLWVPWGTLSRAAPHGDSAHLCPPPTTEPKICARRALPRSTSCLSCFKPQVPGRGRRALFRHRRSGGQRKQECPASSCVSLPRNAGEGRGTLLPPFPPHWAPSPAAGC